ncbi:M20 family metallopeptidase [Bacillus pseudomycoides]|uniref:N-acyl-L-amino acid amidohydrolase n=1 Tax=Bacillus pseudomycoides TaxID=64104 RepID=A0A2C3V8T8_9BACI|nr:M20 family metallopeptidase [Bacillus pseudomycoides]PEM67037.1 N-acyl-L-amino acid amidohydrolase [Bacillus pseudomycoides]PFZ14060.1 N-acyl-L-amino acid amidohydrolase [Bacillus pseudomycoides]PFZ15589.1 N-acyl-L-amino acid amidohydrolase [Bacillus pseudomycoides]PGC41749.1 N-acyl-L-amino acid amidohydrolase [Bacillus pseudomycoides]PGD33483.1 N-acyl-L-amino acid amidohydrolase [Bacillus pseudomycoides]
MGEIEEIVLSKERLIKWRRHFHRYPELSFQEEKTSQYIYDILQTIPHLEISRPTKYSIMARLIGEQPGKVIAIRADMDALPIQEENQFEFVSNYPGVMHACGHDGHIAILLGAIYALVEKREKIKGEIRFLFQHAEENFPGGAEEMVAAGVMENVDYIIGAHLWASLEVGKVGVIYGPAMAAPDVFKITIEGKGGHAGIPHETVDSIAIGTQVVTQLQQIVSRLTNPLDSLVLSVTQFHAGTTHNVIPEQATIEGTVRTLKHELREQTAQRIEKFVKHITESYGANYTFSYEYGYRPVVNDEQVTQLVEHTALELYGRERVVRLQATMAGEDFSAFLQKAPGTFFFIGAGNKEKGIVYPHHHPRFTIDEDALLIGVEVFVSSVLNFMRKGDSR